MSDQTLPAPGITIIDSPSHTRTWLWATCGALVGMAIYVAVAFAITPALQALYPDTQQVYFPLTAFNDGSKYVAICTQGYGMPINAPLTTLGYSRTSWMPVYPLLQCALHAWGGVSLVVAGFYISVFAAGASLFFGTLSLDNLHVRAPVLHTFAAFIPPIGAAWVFMSGAEPTYLALSMFLMWVLTLPTPNSRLYTTFSEWLRTLVGIPLGLVLILTKPNALQLILPLGFAFIWLSWKRSVATGYRSRLLTFITDLIAEHIAPLVILFQRLRGKQVYFEARPIVYDWMPATVVAGILLGFAGWQCYASFLNGAPLYALREQLTIWFPQWNSGNLIRMLQYFSTAFNGASRTAYWRVNAAWYLAANLMPLIPAASRRVPTLIRGMLCCVPVFLLISGQVNGTDRHLVSTGLIALGWACWLAPTGSRLRWPVGRWVLLISLASINIYLMLYQMFEIGALQLAYFKW